jgi:NAD(P)-dependent dehydrogenase (short-subunit alcohol dehydrogenase family)
MKILEDLWHFAKKSRRLSLGPVTLHYHLRRKVAQTNNSALQRQQQAFRLSVNKQDVSRQTDSEFASQQRGAKPLAVVVGAGRGFGFALVEKLAHQGFHVIAVARDASRLQPLFHQLTRLQLAVTIYSCDATDEIAMQRMFDQISQQFGVPQLVVYSVQYFSPGRAMAITLPAFEEGWRNNCLGGFITARTAGRQMVAHGQGSIILVGSTSSLFARADHLNLAVGKFGLRALAHVLAHELWPEGIHVAHLVIDAEIDEGVAGDLTRPKADPAHIANAVLFLHQQPQDCWTCEMDLRPGTEQFWQHC